MEIHFAERLLDAYPRLRVDLRAADLTVDVEVRRHLAFVSYERIAGIGGLPTGSGGHCLALLSGGIDSPVASLLLLKRGCTLDFVTFHSDPYTPPALLDKVSRLTAVLNRYQPAGRLVAVNLVEAQKLIRDRCAERLRTVLYRRLMFRVATVVAGAVNAKALATGENLGQVASQTLESLGVIAAATPMLVLRPLLAFDKRDTVRIATERDTFAISCEAAPDSCTVFAPANPVTAPTVDQAQREEQRLPLPDMVRQCVETAVTVEPGTLRLIPMPELQARLDEYLAPALA